MRRQATRGHGLFRGSPGDDSRVSLINFAHPSTRAELRMPTDFFYFPTNLISESRLVAHSLDAEAEAV